MHPFDGKTVLVTGGAQGIGSIVSQTFAENGAFVVIADMDAEAGREHENVLTKTLGLQAAFMTMDVADEDSVRGFMEALAEQREDVDVLVNNAGLGEVIPLQDRPMASWHHIIGVNLTGPYMCVKYALPLMPPGSSIINIASTRAFMSEPNTEPYSASKGGLVALTHALAISLSAQRIRVNAISPGWIDVTPYKKSSDRHPQKLRQEDHAQHPVGRVGTPRDIAEACLFLADNQRSGFITGTNLMVDGGMTVKMVYVED